MLAAPPTGFTELIPAKFHGQFTAHDYAATYESKAADAENTMRRNGFVDGFGVTWVQESTGHILIEFVIAFEGGNGARNWLAYEEASDKSHMEYQHSNSMAGIGPYYGVHLVDPFTHVVIDGFTFVKGNDMFGVGFASTKDDVLSLASTQVRSQYDFAPKETTPSAQWPENASKNDFNDLARILAVMLIVALVAGVGTLVVARVRSRPRMETTGGTANNGSTVRTHHRRSQSAPPMVSIGGTDRTGALLRKRFNRLPARNSSNIQIGLKMKAGRDRSRDSLSRGGPHSRQGRDHGRSHRLISTP